METITIVLTIKTTSKERTLDNLETFLAHNEYDYSIGLEEINYV
jgi:hypothetical protein